MAAVQPVLAAWAAWKDFSAAVSGISWTGVWPGSSVAGLPEVRVMPPALEVAP